jgi:putative addiction module component (TIGR02574 family)
MSTQDILSHALQLPEDDRAEVAHQLLLSLDQTAFDPEWSAAWAVELERRIADLESGTSQAVDYRESIASIRKSLRERTSI